MTCEGAKFTQEALLHPARSQTTFYAVQHGELMRRCGRYDYGPPERTKGVDLIRSLFLPIGPGPFKRQAHAALDQVSAGFQIDPDNLERRQSRRLPIRYPSLLSAKYQIRA